MSENAQIKELLQAEKQADQQIAEARARRHERLRSARQAADEKAEQYRQEMQQRLEQEFAHMADGKDDTIAGLKAELEKEKQEMAVNFEKNVDKVVDWLEYEVGAVHLEVSEALRQSAHNLAESARIH